MFSKAKKKSNGSATAGLPTEAAGAKGATSAAPTGSITRQPSGVPSIISADLTIEGNLISHGDLQIDGTVHGDIRSRTLTLGEHAQVQGGVQAETARICGEITGEINAKTVVLTKTAKVVGDVVHRSLAIEAGAYIDGHCRREEVEEPRQAVPRVANETPAPKLTNGEARPETPPPGSTESAAKAG
jgi:cytoskeletal protein CcmA (bactofilin family)